MPRNYGWAEMPIMGYIEGSINVRPIIKECHEKNKSGILHFVLSTRISACGKARFLTSFLDLANHKILIADINDTDSKLVESCLVCPDCLDSKEYKEQRERDTDENQ